MTQGFTATRTARILHALELPALVAVPVIMTGLEVAGVNLRIEDVLTPEEYDKSKTSIEETPDADLSEARPVEESATE